MSRGDPVYARIDVSLMLNPLWRKASPSSRVLFITCYLTAVEQRTTALPPDFDTKALTDRASLDPRTGRKALQECCNLGLLCQLANGRIHVPGVRKNNVKIKGWTVLQGETADASDTLLETPCVSPEAVNIGTKESREQEDKRRVTEVTLPQPPAAASLRAPQALAPPALARQESESVAATVLKVLPTLKKPLPTTEHQPEPHDLERTRKHLSRFGIGEVVRFLATGSKGGKLTDALNSAIRLVPEHLLREVCIFVSAKAEKNGWPLPKTAAVLTSRLKERVPLAV